MLKIKTWFVYAGDYDNFQSVYAMKKAQLEAAYERQQKEIADLKILLTVTRHVLLLEIWPCLVRRNWIRWNYRIAG